MKKQSGHLCRFCNFFPKQHTQILKQDNSQSPSYWQDTATQSPLKSVQIVFHSGIYFYGDYIIQLFWNIFFLPELFM